MVKNTLANAGDVRGAGSIPGSGRSPVGGHGNSLQYCLKNPLDRGTCGATVCHKESDMTEGIWHAHMRSLTAFFS